MSDIIAVVSPSPMRRVVGVGIMTALGGVMIYMGVVSAASFGGRVALLVFATVALWGAVHLWQSTLNRIELTDTELRTSDGILLARIDDITGIDRGTFAAKPSSGFVLKLAHRHKPGWAPGLWWRTPRRIGVGGVTGAGEAKFMAELLTERIAARGQKP
ncbi:hypothetical protein [Oceaniglobus ichthyenteri]|uniref:hypothetical protein n=1 Tax=Oceaniglobus ichthyenteri TaxID=2136177 RepID=UPI000D3757B9|nr:hypothetical protein [Oceaniglobus ichthyenteri]